MRLWNGPVLVALLAALGLAGCQPASRYGKPAAKSPAPVATSLTPKPPTEPEPKPTPRPLSPDITWIEPPAVVGVPPVPIYFIQEGANRAEWNKLGGFWNMVDLPPPPAQPIALLGGSPVLVAGLLTILPTRAVKIKVPLGLDDPSAYVPPSNPLTLQKWELGKRPAP